jgi:hypothetical protein
VQTATRAHNPSGLDNAESAAFLAPEDPRRRINPPNPPRARKASPTKPPCSVALGHVYLGTIGMKNRRPFGGQDTFPRQSIDHPEPLAGTGPVPESRRFSVRECPNSSRPLTSAPYPAYSMSWSRRRGSGVAPVGISRRSCAGHRDRSAVRGRAYRHKVAESARPPPRNSMEPVRDVAQPSRALFSYAAFAAFAVLVTRCAIETVPIRGAIAIGDGASAQHPRPDAERAMFRWSDTVTRTS